MGSVRLSPTLHEQFGRSRKSVDVAGTRYCVSSDTVTPGSNVATTSRSFSARDLRRRRCTEVITSTRAIVIGLLPGLFPGLAMFVLRRQGGLHRRLTL